MCFLSRLLTALSAIALVSGPLSAATFTVTTTADTDAVCDAECSLREAIVAANAAPGPDTIAFSITGPGCDEDEVCTIVPTSTLPVLTGETLVDGLSQPGVDCGTWPPTLKVVLDGSSLPVFQDGLRLNGDTGGVRGLVVHSCPGSGIELVGGDSLTLHCNFIGTDVTGTALLPNRNGVVMANGIVGGTAPGSRNLISGNTTTGIVVVRGTNNIIQGNYIGTDVSGSSALPNNNGISLRVVSSGISNALIGASTPEGRNLISGNARDGISVVQDAFDSHIMAGNRILGNVIGLAVDGATPLGNGRHGIFLWLRAGSSDDNVIGGSLPGEGNVIAANSEDGIRLSGEALNGIRMLGNFIGTDVTATLALGNDEDGIGIRNGSSHQVGGLDPGAGNIIAHNGGQGVRVAQEDPQAPVRGISILGNSLHDNRGLGIDLMAAGEEGGEVTANDPGDLDSTTDGDGPNDLQNYPRLDTVQVAGNQITLSGSLESLPGLTYRIEVFSEGACDLSGFGEGRFFAGSFDVTTDGAGLAVFDETLPISVAEGDFVTTTATDADGSTSEFSACTQVQAASVVEVPTLGPPGVTLLVLFLTILGIHTIRR